MGWIIRYSSFETSCGRLLSCQVNQPVSLPLTHAQMRFPQIGDVLFGARGAICPHHASGACTVSPQPLLQQIEFVSAQPHSWAELRCASPLRGERSWRKPGRNGIQKQRSVNEVLIAFIKTLTKELKWQKLPFPLKIHINSQKYINNRWGFYRFEGITQRRDVRAWKGHFNGLFSWFCIRDETLYCSCLPRLALFFLYFLLPLCFLQRTRRLILISLWNFWQLVKIMKSYEKNLQIFP